MEQRSPSGAGAAGTPSPGRKPAPLKRNWQPYNDFDRTHYEATGKRPTLQETKTWFDAHQQDFIDCGNSDPPSWEDLKIHRGRFRVDTQRTRQYTNNRRAQKRTTQVKDKAQRAWRKIPAVARMLSLCKTVREAEDNMWCSFLEVFQRGKKTFKGAALALLAVRRMKAAAAAGFVSRLLSEQPASPGLAAADDVVADSGAMAAPGTAAASGAATDGAELLLLAAEMAA